MAPDPGLAAAAHRRAGRPRHRPGGRRVRARRALARRGHHRRARRAARPLHGHRRHGPRPGGHHRAAARRRLPGARRRGDAARPPGGAGRGLPRRGRRGGVRPPLGAARARPRRLRVHDLLRGAVPAHGAGPAARAVRRGRARRCSPPSAVRFGLWCYERRLPPAAVPAPPGGRGLARTTTRQAIQATAGSAFALVVGQLLSEQRWYWAVGATWWIFVNTTSRGETLVRGFRRVARHGRSASPSGCSSPSRCTGPLVPTVGARRGLRLRDLLHGRRLVHLDDALR